ncbi:uncharacterized protein KGF55_002802 [Candida pseudojiufengensis]|uniref:uncharacterized protein n=1 Tax=Candida pseudojiufengensis TaxID=497109 RepID=UPI002224CC43|nr:uncharacterized protein KGF55_002802 [Candida pseudojiufengensis]KAI5963010.1 hypothetical protein KGF55_002802 [Candida pseudojiufengensis]
MELLTLDSFLPYLRPYQGKELLSPQESLKISLLITEILIDTYIDFNLLKFLSRFLTVESYNDIIEERNIEHKCGYFLCNLQPKSLVRRLSLNSNGTTTASSLLESGASTKYQIYNRKPSIILPNTYMSQYCCKEHYQSSIFYRNQLSTEALFARNNILVILPFQGPSNWYENSITLLEEVIAKHKELKQQGKSMAEVIALMNGLNVHEDEMNDETNQLIKLIEDFEIVEKETDDLNGHQINEAVIESDDEDEDLNTKTTSNKVEGYVTSDKSFGGYVV